MLVTKARTSSSPSSTELTSSSTSASTVLGTAPAGEVKSNRSRPGALSDPAWAAESPRALRMPACTRWVAVCDREIADRRLMSIWAETGASRMTSPCRTRPRCTDSPGTGVCTSVTSTVNPSPNRRPVSDC